VGLGWNIHRVWSTDWWERPAEELARIEAAIETACQSANGHIAPTDPTAQIIDTAPSSAIGTLETQVAQSVSLQRQVAHAPEHPAYEMFEVTNIKGTLDDFYDTGSDACIRALIEAVVSKEGPVSLDLVARRVAEHWGAGRVTTRTVKRIEGLAAKTNVKIVRETEGIFLWLPSQEPKAYSVFRIAGDSEGSRRNAEHLPPQEVANALLHILEQHVSLPVEDLVRETARLFGYQRTGPAVDKSMRGGVGFLVRKGAAKEDNNVVVHLR